MDALLGALAMGDIGKLFPDSSADYRDADSLGLLENVYGRVLSAGYRLSNADITIIAQRPRLSPYIDKMRARIAAALEAETDQISVKATTEEGMGFTGEGIGIAAHAVVLLERY
jgi:2-C-methyl-D-erythritol 2,4-cyclodiphosphate synthase